MGCLNFSYDCIASLLNLISPNLRDLYFYLFIYFIPENCTLLCAALGTLISYVRLWVRHVSLRCLKNEIKIAQQSCNQDWPSFMCLFCTSQIWWTKISWISSRSGNTERCISCYHPTCWWLTPLPLTSLTVSILLGSLLAHAVCLGQHGEVQWKG